MQIRNAQWAYIFCCNWVIVWLEADMYQDVGQLFRSSSDYDPSMHVCGFIVVFIIIRNHSQSNCCSIPRWYSMKRIPCIRYTIDSIGRERCAELWLMREKCKCQNHFSNNVFYNVLSKSNRCSFWLFHSTTHQSLISGNVLHSNVSPQQMDDYVVNRLKVGLVPSLNRQSVGLFLSWCMYLNVYRKSLVLSTS